MQPERRAPIRIPVRFKGRHRRSDADALVQFGLPCRMTWSHWAPPPLVAVRPVAITMPSRSRSRSRRGRGISSRLTHDVVSSQPSVQLLLGSHPAAHREMQDAESAAVLILTPVHCLCSFAPNHIDNTNTISTPIWCASAAATWRFAKSKSLWSDATKKGGGISNLCNQPLYL